MRLLYLSWILVMMVSMQKLQAQGEYYPGTIILKSNAKLQGEISINPEYHVAVYKHAEEVMVIPAHKIKSVNIFDEVLNTDRKFISLELGLGAAVVHQFYEIVIEGQIGVLRVQRTHWYSIHIEIPDYGYYVWQDEQLEPLQKFKRKKYRELLKSAGSELSVYIKSKKLNKFRLDDMVEILSYYNQQQITKTQLAKKE